MSTILKISAGVLCILQAAGVQSGVDLFALGVGLFFLSFAVGDNIPFIKVSKT